MASSLPAVPIHWLLGLRGNQTAVDALTHPVDMEEDGFLRKEAISALGRLHDSRALPAHNNCAPGKHLPAKSSRNAIANIPRIEVE